MNSVLYGINGYEDKTVRDLINKNGNRDIWKLIKRGYRFDEEVLGICRITKSIRDEKTYLEIVHRETPKFTKEYKKDNASFDEIVESLSNIEVEEPQVDEEEDDEEIEEFFPHDDE